MEAVNKVINMASHSTWDDTDVQLQKAEEPHDEPISGVHGKGAADDPYDTGNRDSKSMFRGAPYLVWNFWISTRLSGHRLNGSPYHGLNKLTSLGSAEQLDVPASHGNTAPQESKLDDQPLTSVSQPAASSTFDKPPTTANADMAPGSSNTAAAGLSKSTEDTNAGTKDEGKKQRDTNDTDGDENTQKQIHQGRRGTAVIMEDHGISKETLKGPQGPAPHAAAEFEKEGKKETKDEQPAESSGSSLF